MLIILPSLAGGGAEKVTLSLCSNLEYKNVDFKLILLNSLGPLKPRIKKENLIDLKRKRFRNALPSLIKTINLIKPNIIFSTFPHITVSLLAAKIILPKGTRIIAREPNMLTNSLRYSPFSFFIKSLYRIFLPKSDVVIANSQSMYNDLISRGVQRKKLYLIHNPIDKNTIRKVNKFNRYPGKGLRLISVGRLVYQKGYDRLIPILKNINNVHLTILGVGTELNNLKKIVSNLNLNDKVSFKGYINNPNSYIAAADYFILPSRWEGLPNSALESLILGTPVITFSEIEGLLDFVANVDNKNLYLCKNESEMSTLLEKLSIRKDYQNIALRNSLLNKYNTPSEYAEQIIKTIKVASS